jgi:hypothetical protein
MINDIQIKTDFYYYREVSSRFNFFNMYFYDFNVVPSTYKKLLNNIRNIKSKYFISMFKFISEHANKTHIISDIYNFLLNKEIIEILIKNNQVLYVENIPLPLNTNKYISPFHIADEDKSITDEFYLYAVKYVLKNHYVFDDNYFLLIPEKFIKDIINENYN